jgi:16S rRNA (guanine966-N2)-methyltransferase
MRIVGGALGGRRVRAPAGAGTRPTSDRVREAVASVLEARGAIDGAVVLDLYAGTGALAFEALSRGAARAVCVESDRRAAAAIARGAEELGLRARVTVVGVALGPRLPRPALERLRAALGPAGASLVFADPPYALVDHVPPLLAALSGASLVAPGAWVVLEHATRRPPGGPLAALSVEGAYRYGDTAVLLARASAGSPSDPAPPRP